MAAAMATGAVAAATTPFPTLPFSPTRGKLVVVSSYSSSPLVTNPGSSRSRLYIINPLLGSGSFSAWSGLKHLGISFRRSESKGRCKGRMVYASLFGVGAPEALVIGVVALLVFGPKGLAEVARTLGKTLRAFQPTIRELQDVTKEFKSTLEREIGLDEVQSSLKSTLTPSSPVNEKPQTPIDSNGAEPTKPYSSEDLLKVTEEQLASPATSSQAQATSAEDQTQATEGSTEDTTTNSPVVSDVTPTTSSATSEAAVPLSNQEATSDITIATTGRDEDPNKGSTNS